MKDLALLEDNAPKPGLWTQIAHPGLFLAGRAI